MLDFLFLAIALVLGLVALVLAAKAVGYTSPTHPPLLSTPGFARNFLARWLAGGFDYLNRGVRTPRKAPKGRTRGFAPTRPRLLPPRQEAFLALKKARKEERRDKKAALAASRPTNNNAPVQTTQTTATQTAPTTVAAEGYDPSAALGRWLDRQALVARRARRATKRAKAKAKAQQSMQTRRANQPQQVNQVNQTQKVEKTRSIREIAQTQKTQGANAPHFRMTLEEVTIFAEVGCLFRRTLSEAYAVLRSSSSKVVLVGDLVVFHTDFLVLQDTGKIEFFKELAGRGMKLLTCEGEKWAQMGLPVAVRRNGKIYLTRNGQVSVNKTPGAIALGEKEELGEKLLEESGFNADNWRLDTDNAIFRMAKSASSFVFDAYAVHQFNQKKKVIKGVTKLFRCMNERPEIMTAVPGASFSLCPIGGSFGGEVFFIDVTKHEVWGYPLFHPQKNPDCMTEWEVIVSGVFKASWNGDVGMWELTPCEAPKNFDAFSKTRTFGLPGIEQLYSALPENSVVEFVPHKEFAVVEGASGHAIIDIDVDGTEGHLNPDCITASSFEQAIEMAKGALVELQAVNPAWKDNAIVQTGGGIRVYGPVMSPMDLSDEEKEVIERVCDPFYTQSLYQTNRWSFRCTPKIVNDDFRAETMEVIETTPAKQSFVEKLKNFFTEAFKTGLQAFRDAVRYAEDNDYGYVEKTFSEKVYDSCSSGEDFVYGHGYSLSVNRIENFLTFSTHQLLQCYENAKANKLWFWYCEGIGSIDPMIYGQLLADRQIVVIEEFEKGPLEWSLNALDKKCQPLEGFVGWYLTSPETMSEEMQKEINEAITNMASLLIYPDFSKQQEVQVKSKKTWISLGGVCVSETPCFNTSDFVDKYLVHEEDTEEVLRRLIAGERFITCNPSQWKALGYSWANIPGQFKAFLNREGLNLVDIKRIAIQGNKKLSFYVETADGWYEILYKSAKGWVYGSAEPLTGSKVTYFGNGADSFQTAEIKFPVFCSTEIPARPTTSNVGDVFVADEFAKAMYLIGANKFTHEAVAGFALVDDGYQLVYKKMAVFHGSDKVDGHAHQEWFLPLVQEVDLVLCCNWAIALPSDQQHKAIPMWHSRITNSNQGKILKTKAICGSHSILAVTDNKGDDVNRVEWLQLIDGEPSFGTKKLGKKYGVFQMGTFSDRLKKGRVGEAIAVESNKKDFGDKVKILRSQTLFTVQSLKDAYKALNIGAGVVIWDNPEAKVAVGHTEAVKLATPLLKERGVELALTCNAAETEFQPWVEIWQHRDIVLSEDGTLGVQGTGIKLGNKNKEEKVLDHLSLSSGDSAKSPEDNQKEVQMVETQRAALIDAARKVCRRQKDGTISMKYKGSKFVALFNEIVGSEEVRPIVPGYEATPNDNMQGLALPMVAYEGHVGVTNGTFPAFKVEDGQFAPGHYSRAGFAWKGVANFGIYGGETENEHARHPSILRIQYPSQFEHGKDIRIIFCDFANPGIVARLFEVNAVRLPKTGTQAEMEKFIKGLISGLGTKIDPAIDGTIWVSTLGVPFAPKMPKGQAQSTYQYRGTCVFPQEVGDAVASNNADYASIWQEVYAEIESQVDKSRVGWVARLQASTNPIIIKWREGIADLASYLMMDTLAIEQVTQIICGDLAIKENVAIHESYFKESKHYGAYLKGLVATQPWLAPGVVLMDINAVKDISKKPLKTELKANNGVVEAQTGHKYVIGMMQDYSKGGIRVGSQPNTYVRSHKDGVLTVEESIERFVDFVENTVLTELGKGLQVQEVLDQLKKSMNFTNSGDGDMEGQFLVEQIVDAASGFVPAFWNHEAGRRVIRNTIKTLMNRYSFGFMTKAMKRIGTFVSVKSYITDLNLLPAAYQNGDSDELSLFVEFTGGDDKSALGKLPITVVLFKNASFWKALGKDHTLGGILRYPVSNKDMFSGVWIVSPEAIVRDADIARLCGFEGFSATLVENYLRGLAEGYYANSVTIKYLLCGDSDGDTAGTIPMDVDFTVDASSRTLNATIDNGDALFFWAITETRDLVQRKFAELEGFTHLQGKRKINPAAVEHVLGESNIAVGNCALWQQAVKGILDTYDKGLFRAEARLCRRNSRLYGKEEQAWENFTPAQAMDAWTWYVERILIPAYRILPCSLELAIMSQKKDLFEAFKAVTAMLVSNNSVVEYGPADARRTMVLWDIEGSAPAIFTEKIFSNLREMVEKAEWAMLMGGLTQSVMKHLGIGVRQEDGSVAEVLWVAATRTSAMAEKENPETLLANQTDAAWGILDSDGLSWTNSYWVGYLRPHFERIRGKVEAMLHSEATFSKDKQLSLSWNRSYSRGSFNRYNLPNYTTDNNGVIVEDKEAFFEQVRTWYASKITSRLFGMNLHGWTRFNASVNGGKFTQEDREHTAPHYADAKIGAMSLMIVWAYFQKVVSANPGVFSDESEFKKFFLKLDDMCEDNHNTKLFLNWIVEVLWDADTCSEYKEHIFSFAKKHKLPSHANPQKQAWIIYCATLQGDVRVCEYLWAVDKAKQFLDVSPSFDEVRPMFAYFGSYNFISFNDEGKAVVASEKYKHFVSIWKDAQRRHGKALATEYRKSVKDDVGAIVSGWGEKEYASLFALAHQETFQAHANLCRKYDEAHFTKISNELTGQWAATYKANFLTEYASELVFRLDTPTTIAGFLRADRFIFEVVSTEMEAKRICFESTEFQFSVVDLGIKQGPLTVRPVYRKTANSEVHGLELLQENALVGFIGADPTSRVLLYFKSDEMFVNSIVTNLNKEDTKAVYGIKQAKAGGSCYLVQAPHSAKDQQEMLNRFLGAFADEVQDAKFGIVSVKAEMKSPELLLEKTHAEVNKRLAKVNKDSNQKNPRFCNVDVAIERQFKTSIKSAIELTKEHEWLVAMMVACAIGDKQIGSFTLDSEIEMLGNFEIVLGTETYRLQDGIYTVESEIEYEEETVDSMTFDQEPEISGTFNDYTHYDTYVPEDEEEVWYPEEFEATEAVEAVEEVATEAVEEIIETEEVVEVIAEEVIEEAVEEVIEEEPEVVIEQAPIVIKAPVAVIESGDEDENILEQIAGLISKLSPKVRKAFDKGLESGKKALEKEKAKLETKKAKLQADLAVVNKELAEINTALEASNDDDGGDDDGGGNGGGTPAPADNSPAPASAPPAPPAAFESRVFAVNGKEYEIPESFQGLEVLTKTQVDLFVHEKTQEIISEFRGENFFLSNFANARIEHKGVTYKSVEHFYQAMKFTDPNIRARVAGAPNGADAKKIAKQNEQHIRKDWEKIKDDVMWYGIQYKFRGNESHKESLRNTGDAHITHLNTWGDVYWGVSFGKGEDKLGKMLMKVRDEINQ